MMNFETEMNEKITTIIEEMNIDGQLYCVDKNAINEFRILKPTKESE